MLVYWRILGALPDRAKVLALGPWATMAAAAWSAKIVEKQHFLFENPVLVTHTA